jgi:DNA sulfur modification protein DndB
MPENDKPLLLPALRAAMGDWVYYVTTMPMAEVARRIRRADEVHKSRALKELIQRSITNLAGDIADYILRQPQYFFNSIIVGIYGGEPKWFGIKVGGNNQIAEADIPDSVRDTVGVLHLTGQESLFAVDGQHRVEGLKSALARSGKVAGHELTVILVAHRNTASGLQRTRRLFSTLNRYAKPVTPGEIVALDEDHAIAIVTRELLERHPLFSRPDMVIVAKGKAIPASNSRCFTSILALYECMNIVLAPDKKHTTYRPSEAVLRRYYAQAVGFWTALERHFEPIRRLRAGEEPAGTFRHRGGGHLLFRPVGQLAVALAIRGARRANIEAEEMIRRISRMPLELSQPPWEGLLWDSVGHRMRVREDRKKLAASLLQYMARVPFEHFDTTEADLRSDYASALNRPVEEVQLPLQV